MCMDSREARIHGHNKCVHAHKRVHAADSLREGQQQTSGLQVRASCPVQGAHIADDSDSVVCTCMYACARKTHEGGIKKSTIAMAPQQRVEMGGW